MEKTKAISTAQLLCMAFIGGMVIKMFMLPSLLAQTVGRDGVFVMLFYMVVEIINLALIITLIKKYPSVTFYEMLCDLFGSVVSRIIVCVCVLAAAFKFLLNLSEIKAFFSTSMFDSVTWEIMLVPLLALCVAIGIKSLRVIGRSAEIFLPVIIVGMIMLAVIVFVEAPLENALPLLANGISSVMDGIARFPMWFGDVLVLVVAMGNVRIDKRMVLKAVVVRVIVAVVVLMFSVVLFATYGNVTSVIGYGHNVTSLTQYNLGSQEYGRFDLIIYSLWLLGVFLKIAMTFYFIVRGVAFVLKTEKLTPIAVAVAVAVYLLSLFVFPSQSDMFTLSTGWAKYVFCAAEYLVPPILAIGSAIKYRKREGKRLESRS